MPRSLAFSRKTSPGGTQPPGNWLPPWYHLCNNAHCYRSRYSERWHNPASCGHRRNSANMATERTDGKVQLHDVVEHAIAAEDLHPSIAQDVPGSAEAGSNFVVPAKLNRFCGETSSGRFAGRYSFSTRRPALIVTPCPTVHESWAKKHGCNWLLFQRSRSPVLLRSRKYRIV